MMTKSLPSSSIVQHWRELYQAALFERDRQKLSYRIAEAERALVQRARELFAGHEGNSEEAKALNKGLYALSALRTCLKLKPNAPDGA